jgi:hypothetical protein
MSNSQQPSDSAAIQAAAREKIEKAKAEAGPAVQTARKYYSRFKGTKFCFPDGEVAQFMFDGKVSMFETNDAFQIKELDKTIKVNGTVVISPVPVAVRVNDAQFLRDVGSQTGQGGGVGAVNSQSLEALAAFSGT